MRCGSEPILISVFTLYFRAADGRPVVCLMKPSRDFTPALLVALAIVTGLALVLAASLLLFP
jgi:hypothetical protein